MGSNPGLTELLTPRASRTLDHNAIAPIITITNFIAQLRKAFPSDSEDTPFTRHKINRIAIEIEISEDRDFDRVAFTRHENERRSRS